MTSDPGTYTSGGFLLQFEFYPALKTTHQFLPRRTSAPTCARRFVENMGSGQCRIGGDGTNAIGYSAGVGQAHPDADQHLPPVRDRHAGDQRGTTRDDCHAARLHDDERGRDRHRVLSTATGTSCSRSRTSSRCGTSPPSTRRTSRSARRRLTCGTASPACLRNLDIRSLTLTSNFAGGTITEWGGPRGNAAGTTDHDIEVSVLHRPDLRALPRRHSGASPDHPASRGTSTSARTSRSTTAAARTAGCWSTHRSASTVNNHDHVDRYIGATNATTPYYAVQFTNSCAAPATALQGRGHDASA